jgi:hypothetical protein
LSTALANQRATLVVSQHAARKFSFNTKTLMPE